MPAETRRKRNRAAWIASCLALVVGIPSPANAAGPSNDDFASRTLISSLPYTAITSTEGATVEPSEPLPVCGYQVGSTIWYEYKPALDGIVRVDTQGSAVDTVVAVWTGAQLAALSNVTCNDDHEFLDSSVVYFQAKAGTSYFLQVGGAGADAGDVSVRVEPSNLGGVSGTVTSSAGGPLREACVSVESLDLKDTVGWTYSTSSGSYFVGGIPDGSYFVRFMDCDEQSGDHEVEWYDDSAYATEGDQVRVLLSRVTEGINAELTHVPTVPLIVGVSGGGRVTSPLGIDCPGDCEADLPWGTRVTLTAWTGDIYDSWVGCDEPHGNECVMVMDSPSGEAVNVLFEPTPRVPSRTTILSKPDEFTASRSATLEFSSEGLPSSECSLDGSAFEPCTSPIQYESLGDGNHWFVVRGVDDSGRAEPNPTWWVWTVDTTGPELLLEAPTAGVYVDAVRVGPAPPAGPTTVVGHTIVGVWANDPETQYVTGFEFEVNGVRVPQSETWAVIGLYMFEFSPDEPGTYEIEAHATNQSGVTTSMAFEVVGVPA